MATFYLDVDDEITSAAARIRGSADVRIALVLPAGSRIATSRINFRLLAREAQQRSRRLAIVAPEASARAVAASAGLPVYATVMEYEGAETSGRPADGGPMAGDGATAGAGPGGPAATAPVAAPTVAMPRPAGGAPSPGGRDQARRLDSAPTGLARAAAGGEARAVGPSTGFGPTVTGPRPGGGRRRTVVAAAVSLLVLAVIATGVGGYVFLPTATIVLTPATKGIGPVELTVTADPSVTAPDPATNTVPAATVEFPVSVEGTFPATGKRVEETKAKGSVRWLNCNYLRSYSVDRGTIVRTNSDVEFATVEDLLLPNADVSGVAPNLRITCSARAVGVTAAKAGTAGNVAAGAIRIVPGSLDARVISVTNPAATSGGTHEEFARVVQKDLDAARATLEGQLAEQLPVAAAEPPDVPAGAVVAPGSAALGEATPAPDPATLLDQEVAEFTLSLQATGSVLAVAPADVRSVAAATLGGKVPDGYRLDPASVAIEVGNPIVDEDVVTVSATSRASAVRQVEAAEIRRLVSGKSPAEAASVLAPYGTVEITLWPDWASTITGIDARLSVEVREPAPPDGGVGPTPGPEATGGPTPAPTGTAAP